MALDYEKFMLKQTEWRGEVTNKLDNINRDVDEIKSDIKDIKKQINRTNVRVATIAGTVSGIIAMITLAVAVMV